MYIKLQNSRAVCSFKVIELTVTMVHAQIVGAKVSTVI